MGVPKSRICPTHSFCADTRLSVLILLLSQDVQLSPFVTAIFLPQNRRHGGQTVSASARTAAQVLVLTFATSNPPDILLYILLPRRA